MKNIINYYYLLDCSELRMLEKNYIFSSNNQIFIFYSVEDVDIQNISFILNKIQYIPYIHTPIYNKDKQLITLVGNNKYILFKINIKQNRNIQIKDLFDFYNIIKNYLGEINNIFRWNDLWKEKIDYLEYYINSKDDIKNEIKCLFTYYIGLGENAISYLKNISETNNIDYFDKMGIVHKRLSCKYTLYDLYNPLTFVIDHISRDISEYLKSVFFEGNYDCSTIEKIIKNADLSEFGYKLLYARLLFPTFFFDLLDKYESDNFSSYEILDIFNMTKRYEEYLIIIYEIIKKSRKINLPRLAWLYR